MGVISFQLSPEAFLLISDKTPMRVVAIVPPTSGTPVEIEIKRLRSAADVLEKAAQEVEKESTPKVDPNSSHH